MPKSVNSGSHRRAATPPRGQVLPAAERVARWLEQNRGFYCDKCLAKEIGLPQRRHANGATRALAGIGNFVRNKGTCGICGAFRMVTGRV